MSATITTTTTTTTYTTSDPYYAGNPRPRSGEGGPESHDILPGSGNAAGNRESLADTIDDMALPSWLKGLAKNMMGLGDESTLPSEAGAAKTINNFQNEQDIGLLSVDNLKMMAETGYCKDKDGNTVQVPEEVQGAAQRMMENNGELFKKLESATDGKHDGKLGQGDFDAALKDGTVGKDDGNETVPSGGPGNTQWGGQADNLPSSASAAKTVNDFQKDKDIGLLSIDDVRSMAETGYCKDKDGKMIQVPEEVQLAAQKMLENNGELFKKLESATDGKHDGKLGQGDYDKAIEDGTIARNTANTGTGGTSAPDAPPGGDGLPSSASAAKTVNDFQKDKDIGLLSIDDVRSMAQTGYCKDKDGNTVQVPEEVQLAAQKMLENNGELFKKLEAATDGKHDGKLGQGDYGNAVEDGTIDA